MFVIQHSFCENRAARVYLVSQDFSVTSDVVKLEFTAYRLNVSHYRGKSPSPNEITKLGNKFEPLDTLEDAADYFRAYYKGVREYWDESRMLSSTEAYKRTGDASGYKPHPLYPDTAGDRE